MTATRKPVCVTVLSHPNQHLAPAFRAVEKEAEIEHVVVYESSSMDNVDPGFNQVVRWDVDLLGGYRSIVLGSTSKLRTFLAVWNTLRQVGPDVVVIHGWGKLIDRAAIVASVVQRKPFLLTGDTSAHHQFASSRYVIAVRSVVLRLLFALSNGALITGSLNRDFYLALGMRPERLFQSCIPIDVARFDATFREHARLLRIVFAGKLYDVKGVSTLIDALDRVRDLPWKATIAGDGPDRRALETKVAELGLGKVVSFAGFVNQSALPELLADADIVAVPSWQDNRVLVASEALAASCAVIVSTGTGVWGDGDIVEHEVSGLVVPPRDDVALADALRRLLTDGGLRRQLATEGHRRVLESQSPDCFAQCLAAAAARFSGDRDAEAQADL